MTAATPPSSDDAVVIAVLKEQAWSRVGLAREVARLREERDQVKEGKEIARWNWSERQNRVKELEARLAAVEAGLPTREEIAHIIASAFSDPKLTEWWGSVPSDKLIAAADALLARLRAALAGAPK